MFLKLIVIAAVLYGIYRLAGGKLLPERSKKPKSPSKKPERDEAEEETLVECSGCSVYVVKKEAIVYKGKYYCSKECLPK